MDDDKSLTELETEHQRALDFLRQRKRAYQLSFQNPAHNEALKDLARFARIGKAPYHPDQRKNDILIGRQEMYYRIIEHLNLQPDELYAIYNPQPTKRE